AIFAPCRAANGSLLRLRCSRPIRSLRSGSRSPPFSLRPEANLTKPWGRKTSRGDYKTRWPTRFRPPAFSAFGVIWPMFDTLSDRLGGVFDKLRGRGALKEQDVRDAMREVRIA